MIDFGLSKSYIDEITKKHILFVDNRELTGSMRFSSVNSLMGYEQSRRDDLESLAYNLVYFLKGSLPWQGINSVKGLTKLELIQQKKLSVTPKELCYGLPGIY